MRGKNIKNEFEKIFKKDIDGKLTALKIKKIFSENDIPKEYLSEFIDFLEKRDIIVEEEDDNEPQDFNSGSDPEEYILLKDAEFDDEFNEDDIKDLKDIAYVPQAHSFSFSYTVKELSIMGRAKYLNIFSTPSKSDYDIVEKVLDEMGILHLKDRKCSELSGGQLQLVFLARALVGEPKILILDEPESHLDFKNQTKILRTIVQLAKKKNITCIFNTHYPEYALRISDKSMLIGKDDYIIGKTSEVINEENLKKYFGINTKIVEIEDEKQKIKSVVITDNLEKE